MKLRPLVGIAALLLAASACGISDDEPEAGEDGLEPVTVGVMPIVEAAAVYVAKDQGYFSDEGLDVTIETGHTSSAILPGVVSGEYDFGFSTLVTLMLARGEGLDLTAVAAASQPTSDTEHFLAIIAQDPEIKDGADLTGKKVGLNALKNIAAVELYATMKDDGGDTDDVDLVEVGFPDQINALKSGDIDAGLTVEPFLSQALTDGMHVVGYPEHHFDPDIVIAGYVSTVDTAEEDSDKVEAFQRAVYRAAELMADDPDVLADAVADFSDIAPEVYAEMAVPRFPTEIPESSAQTWAELMLESGMVDELPDLDGVIHE